ncbi:MAG: hypothetical protein PHT44_04355 [Candidatus Portnoybacteria bacterium]|nr:hypothetical protein [Candidatus Portnoybacteria bacterium]MDD4983141.1 hypothetical protein [Candidatus Portnoybacteria bacterium]
MVVFLGLLDIHATILLLALALSVKIPVVVLAATILLLFAKACISITDIGALQDIAVIIILLVSIFTAVPAAFLCIAAVIIGIKGLSSLAA